MLRFEKGQHVRLADHVHGAGETGTVLVAEELSPGHDIYRVHFDLMYPTNNGRWFDGDQLAPA